nr:secreted protein [Achlya hypogyna]
MHVPALLLGVLASCQAAAPLNTTAIHGNDIESIQDEFPANQWGIQRATLNGGSVTRHDSWLTLWGGIVNTRCLSCGGGGRAWEVMSSEHTASPDMLRQVQDNQCLDAYLEGSDPTPRVHGWACDRTNANQQWGYRVIRGGHTFIPHKRYREYCLTVDRIGNAFMIRCDPNDERQVFSFAP